MAHKSTEEEKQRKLDERVKSYNDKVLARHYYHNNIDYSPEFGKRFGRLIIEDYIGMYNSNPWFKCKCDCGRTTYKCLHDLKRGNATSCGCFKLERNVEAGKMTIHGFADSRLERIYTGMYRRCYNPKHHAYENYGGRGIGMCVDWLADRINFYEWAIENGYSDDLTLERRDVNGNYSPENCYWATHKTQANNTRSNIYITVDYCTFTAAQWGEILGTNGQRIIRRIRRGWTPEEAIYTPVDSNSRYDHPCPVNRVIQIPENLLKENKYELYGRQGDNDPKYDEYMKFKKEHEARFGSY